LLTKEKELFKLLQIGEGLESFLRYIMIQLDIKNPEQNTIQKSKIASEKTNKMNTIFIGSFAGAAPNYDLLNMDVVRILKYTKLKMTICFKDLLFTHSGTPIVQKKPPYKP
jgi:hypothetical protein